MPLNILVAVPVKSPTKLLAVNEPTLIADDVIIPVAFPVKSPAKLMAVTTPTFKFFPCITLDAVPVTTPSKEDAVITPDTTIPEAVTTPTGSINCALV